MEKLQMALVGIGVFLLSDNLGILHFVRTLLGAAYGN